MVILGILLHPDLKPEDLKETYWERSHQEVRKGKTKRQRQVTKFFNLELQNCNPRFSNSDK